MEKAIQSPAIELEWDGIRVVGSRAPLVIQSLYYLINAQFTQKWARGSKNQLTVILEASKTPAILDDLSKDTFLGEVVASLDDKKFLSSWPRLKPTAWLSLSAIPEGDGCYMSPNKKAVIISYQGTTNLMPLAPWILKSNQSDQLAFLAAAFAFAHRYDLIRE